MRDVIIPLYQGGAYGYGDIKALDSRVTSGSVQITQGHTV
jgi:hypothetical protein